MLSGETTSERPRDRVLCGESRNIINKSEDDDAESISSSDDSRPQSRENASKTTSNSDVSEVAIHSLLVEWKQCRNFRLDYFRILIVRTNLESSVQEATPLKKIWCVKLMDDAHTRR